MEATAPITPHAARYRGRAGEDPADARLVSPVFSRNMPPLLVALAPWFAGRTGRVLEVGAGTGQHAAAFRLGFPALDWIASDPDAEHRASIAAWAAEARLPPAPVLDLDAAGDWPEAAPHAPFTAILTMNVIHIAPVAVLEGIVAGAGRTLVPGGLLVFYGPFRERGGHTSEGNRAFDAGLRADNPDWGLRDAEHVADLAQAAGLSPAAVLATPANNRLLIFRR